MPMSETRVMQTVSLLHKIDAVTIPVPDLDAGLAFYRDQLGHELRWRNDAIGQAGLELPDSDTEVKGHYVTDDTGRVTGVASHHAPGDD
jgi:catechol 2,3-dioxygenase-like lactoylglutathione lyase family enzyme